MAEDKTFEGGLPIGAGFYPRSKGYFLLRSEDVQVDGSKSLADYIDEGGGGGSGGDSTDYTTVWLLNETPDVSTIPLMGGLPLSFTSNDTLFKGFCTPFGVNGRNLGYMYAVPPDIMTTNIAVCDPATAEWADEAYRTITVHEEIADENVKAWLLTNARLLRSGDRSAEMPIIRFVSLSSANGRLHNPTALHFTIEIIGGGPLRMGDYLELCAMRTCKRPESDRSAGKKRQRLRKLYSRFIDDTGQKTIILEIPGEDMRMLFKNDRKLAESGDCRSPIYLRIKRPFFDAYGNENFAKFSNIIRLEKSYSLNHRILTVK